MRDEPLLVRIFGSCRTAPSSKVNGKAKRICLYYLLVVWSVYGIFINTNNQRDFNLQQMGVDAIVTHHTFELGHSKIPSFSPGGDTFRYGNRIYAAKQPGQFILSSIPYALVSSMGITYESNYDLASSLVTWLSSSLLAALAGCCLLYLFLSVWQVSQAKAVFCAALFNFATGIFPYAGVTHHDTMATSLAMISYVIFECAFATLQTRNNLKKFAAAGFISGMAPFVSMLAVPVIVTFILKGVFLLRSKRREGLVFLCSFLLGVAPIFLYNWYCFDSAFLPPNIAGGYADTYPRPSVERMIGHLRAYMGDGWISLLKYYPIMMFGMFAPAFLKKSYLNPKMLFLWMACAAHILFICSIQTLGDCQFGPRYLLPLSGYSIIPLVAVGIVEQDNGGFRALQWLAYLLGFVSVLISTSGAILGTMLCDIDKWQPTKIFILSNLWTIQRYPLFNIASGIFAMTILAFVISTVKTKSNPEATP